MQGQTCSTRSRCSRSADTESRQTGDVSSASHVFTMKTSGPLASLALLGVLCFPLVFATPLTNRPSRASNTVTATLLGPVLERGTDFFFECKVSSSVTNVAGTYFNWKMDGVSVLNSTYVGFRHSHKVAKSIWRNHIGQNLSCEATVVDKSGSRISDTSGSYKGEIKVANDTISLTEGQTVKINVTSTLPIVCECAGTNPVDNSCELPLEFQPPSYAPLSVLNNCEIRLSTADWNVREKKAEAGIVVTTKQDLAHKGENHYTVHFIVRAADHCQTSIWNGARINPVKIHTEDEEVKTCVHSGDPHVSSFDGKRYSFYPPGTYLMHRSKVGKDDLQVQNVLYPRNGVRICGTAVSLGSYTVALHMCDGSSAGNIPVLVANKPSSPKNILIEKKNNEYQITAATGQVVKIRMGKSNLDVTVMALASQVEKVNTTTCSSYVPGSHMKSSMPELERFQVKGSENLFNKMTPFTHYFPVSLAARRDAEDAADDNTDKFCLCGNNGTIDCQPFRNSWDPSRKVAGWRTVQPQFQEMTNVCGTEWDVDLKKWHGVLRTWPTWSGITETEATQTCEEAIRNYTLGNCQAIMQDAFQHYVDECKEDLLIMDDLEQTDSSVAAFEDACVTRALKNVSNYQTDAASGQLSTPKVEFAQARCPNHCSLRGQCVRGRCKCRGNFRGVDCSLVAGSAPRITGVLGGPVCDSSARPCLPLVLGVDNVEENDDAYFCQVTRLRKDKGGRHSVDHDAQSHFYPVRFLSRNSLLCNISRHDGDQDTSSSFGYHVMVRHLEVDTVAKAPNSNAVSYLVYDGTCRYCDEHFTCYLRDETCHIDGHCYKEGKGRGDRTPYVCHPARNPLHWT